MGPKAEGDLEVGSVVLIRQDNTPRLLWPLGVVQNVYPGRDGVSRAVQIKTKSGVYVRPIQRLHCLEVGPNVSGLLDNETTLRDASHHEPSTEPDGSNDQNIQGPPAEYDQPSDIAGGAKPSEDSLTKITRVGRVSKPPVKLDL